MSSENEVKDKTTTATPRPFPCPTKSGSYGEYRGQIARLYPLEEWDEIERRWNAHDALVEALDDLLEALRSTYGPCALCDFAGDHAPECPQAKARNALRQAGVIE